MSNRRFEMHEYRPVIHRMRLGESDRAIAKAGRMGRLKWSMYGRWGRLFSLKVPMLAGFSREINLFLSVR